jgi:hypothetical protein
VPRPVVWLSAAAGRMVGCRSYGWVYGLVPRPFEAAVRDPSTSVSDSAATAAILLQQRQFCCNSGDSAATAAILLLQQRRFCCNSGDSAATAAEQRFCRDSGDSAAATAAILPPQQCPHRRRAERDRAHRASELAAALAHFLRPAGPALLLAARAASELEVRPRLGPPPPGPAAIAGRWRSKRGAFKCE